MVRLCLLPSEPGKNGKLSCILRIHGKRHNPVCPLVHGWNSGRRKSKSIHHFRIPVGRPCFRDLRERYQRAVHLCIPHPGWCASYEKEIPKGAEVEEKDGYLYVTKVWAKGETIRLNFPMEIQFLASNPLVREDAGRVAVKRGPVVYCMEEADNGKNLHLTKLCVNGEKTAEAADELGEHFVRVTAEGRRMKLGDAEKQPLYHLYQKEEEEKTKLKLIPYYMWNNRGEGEMQVWIRACE